MNPFRQTQRLPGLASFGREGGSILLVLAIGLVAPVLAIAQETTDALLRLVPPASPVVLTVESLREHYPAFVSSSLVERLRQLPVVQGWMNSNRSRKLMSARDKIEAFLGTPISEIRDKIFGDAVVVALQAAPTDPPQPGKARVVGLVVLRARDPEMLRRLVRLIDEAQVAGGELARCVERQQGEIKYIEREYPAGSKRPNEFHVELADGTFAVSNSEPLLQELIERHKQLATGAADIKELAGLPGFQTVRRKLPDGGKAACRLFLDPRLLERLLAERSHAVDPGDARARALLGRYLASLNYAGAALSWREGILSLHTAESIDVARLDPAVARWARDHRPVDLDLAKIPASAFAMISTGVDLEALHSLLGQLLSEAQRPRLENLEVALSGILLGQDLHRRIFPALGPSWVIYFDAPEEGTPTPRVISEIPLVLAVHMGDSEHARENANPGEGAGAEAEPPAVTVAAALDNALRTALAVASVDHARNKGQSRVVFREVAGARVTTLDTPIPFAYAVDRSRHRLVIGNSARAVARYLEASNAPEAGARFHKIRSSVSADSRTFIGLDLRALCELAERRRDQLIEALAERRGRPRDEVARDLQQVLDLARLFDAAFATSSVEADASSCVRRIGLIARP